MFKRYGQHSVEAEDNKKDGGLMTASQKDRQAAVSFGSNPEMQDAPARMDEGHPRQMPHSSSLSSLTEDLQKLKEQMKEQDPYAKQEGGWTEKIASLPAEDSYLGSDLEGESPETVLGEGVVFKGKLQFKRFLRIDGQFEGELLSEGKLVIGPNGIVKSNITMNEVVIEGYVEGNIKAKARVELRDKAKVYGDVNTGSLSVDDGVTLIGKVTVSPDCAKQEAMETDESDEN